MTCVLRCAVPCSSSLCYIMYMTPLVMKANKSSIASRPSRKGSMYWEESSQLWSSNIVSAEILVIP